MDPARKTWTAALGFVLGAAAGAGFIVRDCALTCNVGYKLVPFAFLAIAVLTVPFVALQARLVQRVSEGEWQTKCALLAGLGFLGFRALTWQLVNDNPYASPTTSPVVSIQLAYLAFYVGVDPVVVLLFTNLVKLVKRLHPHDLDAALGVMGAASLGGGMAGSALANVAVPFLVDEGVRYEVARDHLMLVMGAGAFAYAALAKAVTRRLPPVETSPVSLKESAALLEEPRLRWVAAILVLTGAACMVLEYIFLGLVSDEVSAENGRTTFFARFYFGVNVACLALLLLGSTKLIRKAGLTAALLTLPIALLGGGAWLALAPSLAAIIAIRIGKDGILRSVFAPATEVLMVDASGSRYDLVRTVVGGLGFSSGMGLAAVALLGLARLVDASRSSIAVLLGGVAVAWIAAVLLERRAR